MPSTSLESLRLAITEVADLGKASHPTLGSRAEESLRLARAVGRGQIVLLSAHFERYIYALNEELVIFLNARGIPSERWPENVRLLHSMTPVDELAKTNWENRSAKLQSFATNEAWLWRANQTGVIAHERLLVWMKAPNPENLVRFFRLWGFEDVFSTITRKATSRTALWLGLRGLVELRNNIAHGDFQSQVTQQDIRRYMRSIRDFSERVDWRVARMIGQQYAIPPPW